MTHVIAILNPKGGTGKTTLSINLARAFQQSGFRVLIVDSDPQGTARDWSQASQEHYPEANMPSVVGLDRPTLDKEIPAISYDFDLVIIDGAAKLHQLTASALKVADTVLIPVQTSSPDIWSAMDLVDVIKARQSVTAARFKSTNYRFWLPVLVTALPTWKPLVGVRQFWISIHPLQPLRKFWRSWRSSGLSRI
jgi:chromosome partitioning protein